MNLALPEARQVLMPVPFERRASTRFPVEQAVELKILRRSGTEVSKGATVNMSSTGVLIATEHALRPGDRISLAMDWPVLLDRNVLLRFVARGRIVRVDTGVAAVSIDKYEFRTRRPRPAQAATRLAHCGQASGPKSGPSA